MLLAFTLVNVYAEISDDEFFITGILHFVFLTRFNQRTHTRQQSETLVVHAYFPFARLDKKDFAHAFMPMDASNFPDRENGLCFNA